MRSLITGHLRVTHWSFFCFHVLKGPFSGRSYPNSTMIGIGLTPEGINQNDVIYEFMMENTWRTAPAELTTWCISVVNSPRRNVPYVFVLLCKSQKFSVFPTYPSPFYLSEVNYFVFHHYLAAYVVEQVWNWQIDDFKDHVYHRAFLILDHVASIVILGSPTGFMIKYNRNASYIIFFIVLQVQ